RYDYFTTVKETRGRFSVFDPNQGLVQSNHIYNAPKGDFGPRIGIAFTPPFQILPGRQTIIRAGFGIYYDTMPLTIFEEGLAQNPIGPTPGFVIIPTAPVPFGVGVPIFTASPEPPFNATSIQHNIRTPNTQIWNLNIQQELAQRVVFQLGYVG